MNWGAQSEGSSSEEPILLGDWVPARPHTLEAYGNYIHDPKNIELHVKQPLAIDRFSIYARQSTELFFPDIWKGGERIA